MNNLKLKSKILLILVFPILSILFLSSSIFYDEFKKKDRMSKTSSYLVFSLNVNNLINDFQEERFYSIKYIENYGDKYSEELKNQIKNTNKSIEQLDEFLKNINTNSFDKVFNKTLNKYLKDIKTLKKIRFKIQKFEIDEYEAETYFSNEIDTLRTFLDNLVAISNNGMVSNYSEAFVSLSNTIEYAQLERLLLGTILDTGKLTNKVL